MPSPLGRCATGSPPSPIPGRYNDEEWLALEALECLAAGSGDETDFCRGQYRAQVQWGAKAMGLRRVDATFFTRDGKGSDEK